MRLGERIGKIEISSHSPTTHRQEVKVRSRNHCLGAPLVCSEFGDVLALAGKIPGGDHDEVRTLADDLVVLRDGRLQQEQTTPFDLPAAVEAMLGKSIQGRPPS